MLSDEMHDGLFQHRGGQAPAGEVLLATVLDEVLGDVVAEPLPVFLFGVARRQPVCSAKSRSSGTRSSFFVDHRPIGAGQSWLKTNERQGKTGNSGPFWV